MMFNADLDGYPTAVLAPEPGRRREGLRVTWLADWGYADISVVEHEMGHGFGLPHSSGMYGEIYDNYWDVMSWDRHNIYTDPTYGKTGQHTIAYHKDLLGWLEEPGNQYTVPTDGGVYTFNIERLALPVTDNYRMVILPVKNSDRFYTLERRSVNGYDKILLRRNCHPRG